MADGVKKINELIMKEGRVIGITKNISASKFDGGTLFIDPNEGILQYNNISGTGAKSWEKFLPTKIFDDLTIRRSLLENNIINASKLENNSVIESKIKDGVVSTNKIKNNAITTEKITDLHVTSEKINNLAITEYKIRDGAVTKDKIKDSAIDGNKIAKLSINANHITDQAVTNAKIYNKTITNAKIANGTITTGLLEDDCVTSAKLGDNQVLSNHIAQLNVKTAHIADRNVTGVKIAKETIKNEHFSNNTLDAIKLLDNSIGEYKYKDLSIGGTKIKDDTISINKLDSSLESLIVDAIRVDGTNNTATVNGNLKVDGNITATGNITGAKVFNPVFADIAEAYVPTAKFEVGQAVCLSEEGGLKVEALTKDNAHMFLGFVSDQYAACYGATPEQIESGELIAVALTGRIPVIMDTTHNNARVGAYVGIEEGKVLPFPYYNRHHCVPTSSVGKIIDIIDEKTALVKI